MLVRRRHARAAAGLDACRALKAQKQVQKELDLSADEIDNAIKDATADVT